MAETERLFVSYSRKDKRIVKPVVRLMRLGKTPVFQDLDSIEPGKKWRVELAESVADASKIVVFWCSHSAKSKNVAEEWQAGMSLGKELVPVIMDSTRLPRALGEYQGIDIRGAVSHSRLLSFALLGLGVTLALAVGVFLSVSLTPVWHGPAVWQGPLWPLLLVLGPISLWVSYRAIKAHREGERIARRLIHHVYKTERSK